MRNPWDGMSLFTNHCIRFPIPNSAAKIDNFGPFVYGNSVFYLAAPLNTTVAFTARLLAPQMAMKNTSFTFIGIDMLIDPFRD